MGAHRNNFDALRLAAALTVVGSHAYPLSGRVQPMVGDVTLGTIAVYVFFAISGYLVTRSWQHDPNAFRFVAKRMLRVGPGYIAAVAAVSLVLAVCGYRDFTGNPVATVNGSLWTIPYEVYCYLLLVGLCLITRHAGALILALVVASAGYGYFMTFAAFFAAGSVISRYQWAQRPLILAAVIAAGAVLVAAGSQATGFVMVIAPAAVWIGRSSWPVVRSIGRGGDISYGVYLYAFPVQQALVLWLGADTPVALLIALTAMASISLGIASWKWVERPALSFKPQRSAPGVLIGTGANQRPAAAECAAMRAADSAVP